MTVLVASWGDGVFVVQGDRRWHELGGKSVRGLVADGRGGALAVVGSHSLCRRGVGGEWCEVATHDAPLACVLAVGDDVFVGTDDARLLRWRSNETLEILEGFDRAPGREDWYAGTVVIDGAVLGPPLGVRSMSVSADGGVLLVNVHVGGIVRSTDGGATWHATIDVDCDVHDVCMHPSRSEVAIAAAAVGLCVSHDGGATWAIETDGLDATYCSAVAFSGDDVLVAASADHFAPEGGLYRRPFDAAGPLVVAHSGGSPWLGGIADTACLATRRAAIAVVDKSGTLHLSEDSGRTWTGSEGFAHTSSVLLI